MDKRLFLSKLRSALNLSFRKNETIDVLADYEGFFATGSSEGKSEQEICDELGDPNSIALDLAEALGKGRRLPPTRTIVKRAVLSLILLVLAFMHYASMYISTNYLMHNIFLLAAFTVALWFALGGSLRGARAASNMGCLLRNSDMRGVSQETPARTLRQVLPICHILLALSVIIYSFIVNAMGATLEIGVNVLRMSNISDKIRITFIVLTTLVAVFAVYGFYRSLTRYFTVITHALGVIIYLNAVFHVLSEITDPAKFYLALLIPLSAYGVSVIITAFYALLICVQPGRMR